MELSEEVSEVKRGGILQSTSKRVRMIFSVMASPNRIDILRILNSKGPLTYSELKSLAGFKSKKESGKFAYHLRKLLRQSLVALNKSERRYTITNLGKLVLSLARQIEERSIIESGKMYVRTSHESIEEFNSHKIIQSLVREGSLPLELAQKITEEVENRIYKYQTTYLTGSLIREMVNSVLLEHGHEEYRNRLARLGLPVGDVVETLSSLDGVDNGAEGLLFGTGQRVFAEHLLTNLLPKDVADSHLSGDLHITGPGIWSMVPDTVFASVRDMVEGGVDLGGKYLGVSRVPASRQLDDVAGAVSVVMSLIPREASREVVLDGLVPLLSRFKAHPDLERKVACALAAASAAPKYGGRGTLVSLRLQLGSDTKVIQAVIAAYGAYVRMTPVPRIGLVVDHEKGRVSDVSAAVSEVVAVGGRVTFAKGPASSSCATSGASRGGSPSMSLESVSVNLPRLAFESNKDETYFRARLALLMKPALAAMAMRRKDVSDLTTRGLNPLLARGTQYMQRGSVALAVNLVGLEEAVFGILGFRDDRDGRETLHKVVETAVDVAAKRSKEAGCPVNICMTDTEGSARFARLDGEKYGKNSALGAGVAQYSEGVALDPAEVGSYTPKSGPVAECSRLSRLLTGGLLVRLEFGPAASPGDIKAAIEKAAALVPCFRPSKRVPVCGECGFKEEPFEEKCPRCKSPFII